MTELVQAAFTKFDADKSGSISARELRAVLAAIGIPLDGERAAAVLRLYDLNSDGKLDRAEFHRIISQITAPSSAAGFEAREKLAKAVTGKASLHWERTTGLMDLSGDASVVTRRRAECWDSSLGSHIYSSGEHRFTLAVQRSEANDGACMLLGVADAVNPPFEGATVGFSPYFGSLFTDADAYSGSAWGKRLVEGDLRGRANGSKVEVLVDMERRRLSFSVSFTAKDGLRKTTPMCDAGVELPRAVRPWVRLGCHSDSVALQPC